MNIKTRLMALGVYWCHSYWWCVSCYGWGWSIKHLCWTCRYWNGLLWPNWSQH